MMSRNTNKESTTISNVTVPLSICQDDDESVVIESMVYDVPELPVTIYDNSNPTKVSEKIDDILMVNNDKFCNNSSQDDVTLNDFSFISQEEYDEINSHEIEIERITRPESTIIIGNRIVEVERFAELCMELQFKHSQICTLGLLKVHNEKRKGLVSTVVFRCNMCSYQAECSTQRGDKDVRLQLNYACVWAALSGGTSYKTMTEFLSTMNIPPLSFQMFHSLEEQLAEDWKKVLWKNFEEAGVEEKMNAVANHNIDNDGIPWITVYVDGGWSHRSYGHHYNAASGVGVIIGKYSGKILFLGVRNKYCCVCARAENKGEKPHEHLCFKNWNGSSGAMEADIISEGFRESIRMHGLKYLHFIGDGDSNVYAKIQQTVPYGNAVRKILCKNHVIKNYGCALYKIRNNSSIAPSGRKFLTANSIKELKNIAAKVIYINAYGDVEKLKTDLENGPYHVFGDHHNCEPSYCENIGEISNRVAEMQNSGIFNHVTKALQKVVVRQGHKLIKNETNNRSEMFMSLLCKFNAGKQLNTIQKGSLQARAYLSALRYNKGADWQSSTWMDTRKTLPGATFQKYIKANKNRHEYDSIRKAEMRVMATKKKPVAFKKYKQDSGYGPTAAKGSLTQEELISERKRRLKRRLKERKVAIADIHDIEQKITGDIGAEGKASGEINHELLD